MYDPRTQAIISAIPNLEEINREELPKIFASLYSDIVSFGNDLLSDPLDAETSRKRAGEVRKISNTLEAYLLSTILTEDEKKASAFVSATGRQLVGKFEAVFSRGQSGRFNPQNSIPSFLSSALLFLYSGYTADAVESLNLLNLDELSPSISNLVTNISKMVQGKATSYNEPQINEEELWENPGLMIFDKLNKVVCDLSKFCFGEMQVTNTAITHRIQEIENLCVLNTDQMFRDEINFSSVFSEQLHLAKLIRLISSELPRRSLALMKAPETTSIESWKELITPIVLEKPYLWDNHIKAIESRYLERGISAVVSLPTGAGKTTIANLKIASALSSSGHVIYLVPTHALGHQVRNSLRTIFPQKTIKDSLLSDGSYTEAEEVTLADITVLTPERFLALIGIHPSVFASVSLLVFDECHLLHSQYADKRSLDSMIALLKALDIASEVDIILMSAMIRNTSELSDWLRELWGKNCVSIAIDWKPTRQLRGCLVFEADQIESVERNISQIRRSNSLARPNAAIKRHARAVPFGFFCLKREWTTSSSDYSFVNLLNSEIPLGVSDRFRLTPNKNELSRKISEKLVTQNKKVLVFAQNRKHCESIASKACEEIGTSSPVLTDFEQELKKQAELEVGDVSKIIGLYDGVAACHHSLMLPQERLLVESLFSRDNGIKLLVATPTLAQGLNLPAEVVILAGDERYNSDESESERMESYEILNAAGRAGRAGFVSNGIVIVIPSKVVRYSRTRGGISSSWSDLRSIFSTGDQSLDLIDPFSFILDSLEDDLNTSDEKLNYLLSLLPRGEENGENQLKLLLKKTLGYHKAVHQGRAGDYNLKIDMAALRQQALEEPENDWMRELCKSTGLRKDLLESMHAHLVVNIQTFENGNIESLINVVFDWLFINASIGNSFFKESSIRSIYPRFSGELVASEFQFLKDLLVVWMHEYTIVSVERAINENISGRNNHDKARAFVLKIVPEISYLSGIFALLYRKHVSNSEHRNITNLNVGCLSSCIREGFVSPSHLAGRYILGPEISRIEIHNKISSLSGRIGSVSQYHSFIALINKVNELMIIDSFN